MDVIGGFSEIDRTGARHVHLSIGGSTRGLRQHERYTSSIRRVAATVKAKPGAARLATFDVIDSSGEIHRVVLARQADRAIGAPWNRDRGELRIRKTSTARQRKGRSRAVIVIHRHRNR